MIQTEKDSLEIMQKIIVSEKDFRALTSRHLTHNTHYTSHSFHMTNSEKDLFIVDWQLSMEENYEGEKVWH